MISACGTQLPSQTAVDRVGRVDVPVPTLVVPLLVNVYVILVMLTLVGTFANRKQPVTVCPGAICALLSNAGQSGVVFVPGMMSAGYVCPSDPIRSTG